MKKQKHFGKDSFEKFPRKNKNILEKILLKNSHENTNPPGRTTLGSKQKQKLFQKQKQKTAPSFFLRGRRIAQ